MARKGPARSKRPEPPRKKQPVPRPPGQEKAIEEFGIAVKLFQKRDLARARDVLKEILQKFPGEMEILDRVNTYLQVCERGLHPNVPRLKDADDFYHQGVFLMNERNFEEATRMFERALAADPASEKVMYAQAATLALYGSRADALEMLRRAVASNHANVARAANDADFESLRDEPDFLGLVRGERGIEV